MKSNIFLKKLFRTAGKYKAQFISMIIMIALGVGVFVGFNMEWYSLKRDTMSFLAATNYADYRIYNELGFSPENISAIKNIEGIDKASRVLSVNVDVKETENSLSLFCLEDYTVSTMLLTSGADYDKNSDGFWLSDKYAKANNISLGDTLTISYRNIDISGAVVGLVKSGEYMLCVADENQLMPDYNTFGFVYASPTKIMSVLKSEYYPQINIISSLDKDEIEAKLNAVLNKTTLILSKEEHYPYAGAISEIEEGQTMGSIIPVLFLLIGVLTMITTMHRITSNEKTQIGTLKALGFKDRKILAHYASYGFFIGLIGAILGILLGFGIAYVVVNPNGMEGTYFDMPNWTLYIPAFCWIVLILTIVFLTLISLLSVKKMLKGTASDALRPYVPKKMKSMAIERTKIWNKMSFSAKWNTRDIVRHKSRTFMTLIGIIGCMVLLVGGLGMSDTMTSYLKTINNVFNYETRVNIVETADNDEVRAFSESLNGDLLASQSIKLNDKAITLEIYDVSHDTIRFIDKNNKSVSITNDGAYICVRLADSGIKIGDTIEFSPYGSENTYQVRVAGILRSVLTENITMTSEYAESVGISYNYSAVFVNVKQNEIPLYDFISGTQTKQVLIDSYDSFTEILNVMVFMLVLAAVVLGVVVLYNLGVMSYVERYRELATLKVVGFKDRRIGQILISQNLWLTVVGIVIGLPAGVGVLSLLLKMLGSEYELKLTIGILTYAVSILLTVGLSFIVSFFISKKNKKIDMVEALKSTE